MSDQLSELAIAAASPPLQERPARVIVNIGMAKRGHEIRRARDDEAKEEREEERKSVTKW